MSKASRLARKVTILQARIASAEGRYDDARALFAQVGIGYVSPLEHANAFPSN